MSSSQDFVEYVCAQIDGTGFVRYLKMFGDYMVYVDDRPILLVCDNTVYVKQVPCVEKLLADADKGIPYHNTKSHYILDIDDADTAREVVRVLTANTPIPQKKIKKTK